MSGVFCDECHKKYKGVYSTSRKTPVQSPNQAIYCSRPDCSRLGLVWLSQEEDKAYKCGQRIFTCGWYVRIQVQ